METRYGNVVACMPSMALPKGPVSRQAATHQNFSAVLRAGPQNGLGVVALRRMLILDRRPLGRWLLTAVREHLGAASRAATYR
jgi:hypothetical protein